LRQSEDRFRAALDAARKWEVALATFIRARGWHVLPTYDFSGKGDDKAPKLLAPAGQRDLVMPDLQCFRNGEVRWIECKWKARADFNIKRGYYVTGISLRLADHYERVNQMTGADVFLLFLHEHEGEVRGGKMRDLATAWSHDYQGEKMGRSGMRFWRWDAPPRWCDLTRVACAELEAAE
jgi:hypothetical protein